MNGTSLYEYLQTLTLFLNCARKVRHTDIQLCGPLQVTSIIAWNEAA